VNELSGLDIIVSIRKDYSIRAKTAGVNQILFKMITPIKLCGMIEKYFNAEYHGQRSRRPFFKRLEAWQL
jgi:hypothetical protein